MTVNAIEKALWQASIEPADGQRLREDAQSYFKDFRIDDEELALLSSWNVNALAARGVNPMVLLMAFAAVTGPSAMMEYVMKINQSGSSARSR